MDNKNSIFQIRHLLILITIVFGLSILYLIRIFIGSRSQAPSVGCVPLDSDFITQDLVGTWIAQRYLEPTIIDTLILRPSGEYQQIVEIEQVDGTFNAYSGEWNHWRVEIASGGIGYLFLEDYRICGITGGSCDETLGPDVQQLDLCNNLYIEMSDNESLRRTSVLIVKGVPEGNIVKTHFPFMLSLQMGPEASAWNYYRDQE